MKFSRFLLGSVVFLFGAFALVGAPVAVDDSALVGIEIAKFVPKGFDPEKTPSLALVAEPREIGALPKSWNLAPEFSFADGKASAVLRVSEGTSLYGGGEVTGPLLRNGQSITLWNTDTGAYRVDNGRRLYQSHPWVLGVRKDGTAFGVIFDSSWKAELTTNSDRIEFRSEGALFRVFVIDRESPQAVMRGLAELTGTMEMPPRWALGYQQCRFSYFPADRVREVAETFRAKKIPCDVIWMDIDYMDGFRIFSFNPKTFPDPAALNRDLHEKGFHSVWMIDPGVKADRAYSVYKSGTERDAWVTTAGGQEYRGKVWPGMCVFPDFTRPETRQWWSGLYQDFLALGVDGVWNDMNEPAVFESPNATMPLDNLHRGGGGLPAGPHLLYHNAYGRLMAQATRDGILAAHPDRRPFVLSRANFLGGQRYAAAWTGDNASTWAHMKLSIPMSLTLGLSGQPFNGPDIGGFLDPATPELWGNWIGFGAFFPFARGHACDGTPPKEPWAFGSEVENAARIALERRYRLLPYFYTIFHESSRSGLPIMRPVFFANPKDFRLRAEEQAFLIGGDLLVVAAWAKNPALPDGIWRDLSLVENDSGKYQAKLKIRGGAILPVGKIVQNTMENSFDPLTLVVCLDGNGNAAGDLYRDAGDGWGFKSGDYSLQHFTAKRAGDSVTVRLENKEGAQSPDKNPVNVEVLTPEGVRRGSGSLASGISVSLSVLD